MPNNTSESRVFISYSREDNRRISEIYRKLSDSGINVWMDQEDIRPGEEWNPKIQNVMKSARLILIFLSHHSITNDGYQQREINYARELQNDKAPGKIFIMPVKLDNSPMHARLTEFNYIDLSDQSDLQKLMDELKNLDCIQNSLLHKNYIEETRIEAPMRQEIPYITFPREIDRFLSQTIPFQWDSLSRDIKRSVLTLGCKLEPIVQIIPATTMPQEIGFECLALGTLGENFPEICKLCRDLDPGLLRITLAIIAVQTVALFQIKANRGGYYGARNLIFSINLDPVMVESEYFKKFLVCYQYELSQNIIFEVNESTTQRSISKLKNLQVDFNLRFSADDLNAWDTDVRNVLIDRVEMTKMDYKSFSAAMQIRGDNKKQAIEQIRKYKITNKPLIVEGVQDNDYIQFLQRNWDFKKYGYLYGQGYCLESSFHWEKSNILSLKPFELPPGSYLSESNTQSDAA